MNLGRILEDLFDDMVAKDVKDPHGTDNMTAVLIKFEKMGTNSTVHVNHS